MNTPEQLNTISFRSMLREEHSYNNNKTVKLIKKSGVRLSYVKIESNNNALVTRWVENYSTTYTRYEQRRYLPPHTEKIIDAATDSDSCAILAMALSPYTGRDCFRW